MDEAERNEIAYKILELLLEERGIRVGNNFRRRVGIIAKQTGVHFDKVLEFSVDITQKILIKNAKVGTPATEDELEGRSDGCHGGH